MRAVSLSQEPVFSLLKNEFVCGYKDIENKGYAGSSRKHSPNGQAVDTTNGAGPHNIQMFVMASDGTVLTCLPGYWNSKDLASELEFAKTLNAVWVDPGLSRDEKNARFSEMQKQHLSQHTAAERKRSEMQHFDVAYEKKKRFLTSDVFNRTVINPRTFDPVKMDLPPHAVKTCDVIMHQRMASRPFVQYKDFDVKAYSDYGRPMYDKNEEELVASNGQTTKQRGEGKAIGNDPAAHPVKTQVKRQGKSLLMRAAQYGIRAAIR